MGSRGPAPQSAKTKLLNGNPGKRAVTQNVPQPDTRPPECPEWLDDIAKEHWAKMSPELVRMGLLTSVDGDAFAAYCQAYAEFRIATETLRDEMRVCSTNTGYLTPHPCVAMQRSAWNTMKQFSAMFGLDPASRSRLNVAKPGEEKDPFDELLEN